MRGVVFTLFYLVCGMLFGEGGPERTRLYQKAVPECLGGIKGRIEFPMLPIQEILAICADDVEQVYEGEILGVQRTDFQFRGLPVGKYDLLVIYASQFNEGLLLSREVSTLIPADLKKIEDSIQKSEPFFTVKVIHRVEGETGRGNGARAICTYIRDNGQETGAERANSRRTFKLVLMKDVGPGWQITRARDLYPVWVHSGDVHPSHKFSPQLRQIRVADQIKDLGVLRLSD